MAGKGQEKLRIRPLDFIHCEVQVWIFANMKSSDNRNEEKGCFGDVLNGKPRLSRKNRGFFCITI